MRGEGATVQGSHDGGKQQMTTGRIIRIGNIKVGKNGKVEVYKRYRSLSARIAARKSKAVKVTRRAS
jgi:hypothetical protein